MFALDSAYVVAKRLCL